MPLTNGLTWLESRNRNREERRIYEQERLVLIASEAILHRLELTGVTKSELARRLGRSRASVTQLLDGERNMTLRTLADAAFALDCRAELCLRPFDRADYRPLDVPKPTFRARARISPSVHVVLGEPGDVIGAEVQQLVLDLDQTCAVERVRATFASVDETLANENPELDVAA